MKKILLIILTLFIYKTGTTQGIWTGINSFNNTGTLQAVGFAIGNKGYVATGRDGLNEKSTWEYEPATNTWTQKADFGGLGREEAVAFVINGLGYVGLGINGTSNYQPDFWAYDPGTNQWIQKASFGGGGRSGAIAFTCNGKGYAGTGGFGSGTNINDLKTDIWEYNPINDTWTKVTDYPSDRTVEMAVFVINNKAYIGTGDSFNLNYSNELWEYTPATNMWEQKANYPGGKVAAAIGFALNGKGYIGTGLEANGTFRDDFWEYNPTGDIWIKATDFKGCPIRESVSFVINNKAYVGSGLDQNGSTRNDFWEFDNSKQPAWVQKANINVNGTLQAVGFSVGTKGYVTTGRDGLNEKSTWEYDPTTDTWTQKADFGGVGREEAVAFVINGKGYVGTGIFGTSSSGYQSDFWEYDPTTNIWTQKANFGGSRRIGSVAFVVNGIGYVGLGRDSAGLPNDFWKYDPGTDQWTRINNFNGKIRGETASFVINNKAYIGTGINEDGSSTLSSLWQYDDINDQWIKKADYPGGPIATGTGFALNGKGYIGVGADINGYRNDFWEYDPTNDTWTAAPEYGGCPVREVISFVIGNKAYVGTGLDQNGSTRNDFWEFNPQGVAENMAINFAETITSCGQVYLSLSCKFDSYLWSTGSTSNNITITSNGTYWVKATLGCKTYYDTVNVTINNPITVSLPDDMTVCSLNLNPQRISSVVNYTNATYLWNTGETTSEISVNEPGKYWVTVQNTCGSTTDTIEVNTSDSPEVLLPSNVTINCGENFNIQPLQLNNATNYEWNTGETTPTITVNQSGIYWLKATNNCGTSIDSINITALPSQLQLQLPASIVLNCESGGSTLAPIVSSANNNISYLWNTGATTSSIIAQTPGVYTLSISNGCDSLTATTTVVSPPLNPIANIVTPNNDGKNDQFVLPGQLTGSKLTIYNRLGRKIYQSDNYNNDWKADGLPVGLYYYKIENQCYNDKIKGWLKILK